jgi:hypothetical protein
MLLFENHVNQATFVLYGVSHTSKIPSKMEQLNLWPLTCAHLVTIAKEEISTELLALQVVLMKI